MQIWLWASNIVDSKVVPDLETPQGKIMGSFDKISGEVENR
jgi:hypothetical protein